MSAGPLYGVKSCLTPMAPGCRCAHLPQGLRAALQQRFNGSQQAAIAGGMAGSAQITLVQVRSLAAHSLAVQSQSCSTANACQTFSLAHLFVHGAHRETALQAMQATSRAVLWKRQ